MSIFLAGPTPRSPEVPSWRPEALEWLRAAGFTGVVFVPETADGERSPEYLDQVEWERQGLHLADRILFWVPRDMRTLPGLTTNVEFGRWCSSGKAVLGFPPDSARNKYLAWLAGVEGIPVYHTLADTIRAALDGWEEAEERSAGERHVPLHVWQSEPFRAWYRELCRAGNRLDEASLLWSFRTSPGPLFSWVLHTKIWVAAEGRHKENEWVLSRPDVSCAVLYRIPERSVPLDAEVVLVREFRSPARTPDGFVHELPGGSGPADDPARLAWEEVYEEVGLRFAPERFRPLGSRQVAATLASHHAHAFAVELTPDELAEIRRWCAEGRAAGVAADTERTILEVVTVREMLAERLTDWVTVGIVMQALPFGERGA
jgi:hypothetical protein